jgi:hypothetical protein
MEESRKACFKCGIEKPLKKFPGDNSKKNGHKGTCKKCYNAHSKNKRAQRKNENVGEKSLAKKDIKENVKKPGKKFLDQLLQIHEKIKTGTLDEQDDPFLDRVADRGRKVSRKISHPPTNILKIAESRVFGPTTAENRISKIQSDLSLFLMQKKGISNIRILVCKDRDFLSNSLFIAKLPKEILLTDEEVQEFLANLRGEYEDKSISCIRFKFMKDTKLEPFWGGLLRVTKKFLKRQGCQLSENEFNMHGNNKYVVTISWAKIHSITIKDLEILRTELVGYMISMM